ncbi:DRTGG domain-containing protein [Desulfallas thermosapovorans]|uniref:DRTGG domain-containing protein n=1 Tax=Desulfallas thermosapovorans DSM 6562 TaxID=1121431 RepID=A0A5S4ZVT8_9FIRM|nr:DRTGG domain-containing protein [Desulfallas thermosapovorans]TYO96916.1 DRTGG domain-containing protein [Desulfallas thermosapovorans DSM 6562]
MNLWAEIMDRLQLTLRTKPRALKRPIRSAYCGDLLSDVLAHANPGDLWITIHRHRNIVAVAALVKLSGIIITGGRTPDPDTLETAERECIPLFTTPLDNFQAAGKIYAILSDYF